MRVGMTWRIARPSESTPAARAPRMGRRTAADQKRKRVWGNGQPAGDAPRCRGRALAEDDPGAGGVQVGGEDELRGRVGVAAAGDDVLRRPPEEEEAEEVAPRVQVEVERGRCDQDEGESSLRRRDGEDAPGEREDAVEGPDERRLRVDVDGLDLGPPALVAKAGGHGVRCAALGVGAREPALEGAELAD